MKTDGEMLKMWNDIMKMNINKRNFSMYCNLSIEEKARLFDLLKKQNDESLFIENSKEYKEEESQEKWRKY
jgi:hypothetical protein